MEPVALESIPIALGQEDDGRWWADIESMPGVMAYGDTRELGDRRSACAGLAGCGGLHRSRRRNSCPARQGFFGRVSHWWSVKAKQLLAALLRIGWTVSWQNGSHRRLKRAGWANFTFAFHDGDEVGAGLLSRIAKKTGLRREDL